MENIMSKISLDSFQEWMDAYGEASRKNNPQASADLFTLDAKYFESPFTAPIVGQDAILQYWEKGARNLRDKASVYQILSIDGNLGMARWQANYVDVNSGNHIALDCIFMVEFDGNQKCRVFREWWHSQVLGPGLLVV